MHQAIYFARHGNRLDFTDPDWARTAERPFDPPLSDDGTVQARELARRLKGENIRLIFCSPFLRTLQTARFAAEELGLPVKVEHGVCEGLCEFPLMPDLLSPEERRRLFPFEDTSYRSKLMPVFPETVDEALVRSGDAARRIVRDYPDGNILIVAHAISVVGGVRGLIGDAETLSAPLCCLFRAVRDGAHWRLDINGDISHLSRPELSLRSTYTA